MAFISKLYVCINFWPKSITGSLCGDSKTWQARVMKFGIWCLHCRFVATYQLNTSNGRSTLPAHILDYFL